jgi:hypothetical protein
VSLIVISFTHTSSYLSLRGLPPGRHECQLGQAAGRALKGVQDSYLLYAAISVIVFVLHVSGFLLFDSVQMRCSAFWKSSTVAL